MFSCFYVFFYVFVVLHFDSAQCALIFLLIIVLAFSWQFDFQPNKKSPFGSVLPKGPFLWMR